jgi:hypothetical protein
MRSLAFVLLLALCAPAAAQKNNQDESEFLKTLVGAAGASSVGEAKAAALPPRRQLRVFVLAPAQEEVGNGFRLWVQHWNRTEGPTYGRIQLVADASQADIILARFFTPFKRKGRKPNEAALENAQRHNYPSSQMPSPDVALYKDAPAHTAKIYSYITARDEDGLKLLWRLKDSVRVRGGSTGPDYGLGLIEGDKDSKIPGDGMFKEFFKMLRQRGRAAAQ